MKPARTIATLFGIALACYLLFQLIRWQFPEEVRQFEGESSYVEPPPQRIPFETEKGVWSRRIKNGPDTFEVDRVPGREYRLDGKDETVKKWESGRLVTPVSANYIQFRSTEVKITGIGVPYRGE